MVIKGDLLLHMTALIALTLGGLISMSIIITAAGVEATTINNAADLLRLGLIFGEGAKYLLSIGLFAAGITAQSPLL